jgi:hypothetical protein
MPKNKMSAAERKRHAARRLRTEDRRKNLFGKYVAAICGEAIAEMTVKGKLTTFKYHPPCIGSMRRDLAFVERWLDENS